MGTAEQLEAQLVTTNNVLLALPGVDDERLLAEFCGVVVHVRDSAEPLPELRGRTVYLCGDLEEGRALELDAAARVLVIRDRSRGGAGWERRDDVTRIESGRVPLLVHGVGVLYRRFFDPAIDHFHEICREHAFQSLTESTKPAKALRTGIYLTPVERVGEELRFRLLRCSTNLSGPTDNFRAHDRYLVDALNQEAAYLFERQAPLNHVLAQVYNNTPATAARRQKKAKISQHADKTKDMPRSGIMAFCTFYDGLDALRPSSKDPFDLVCKGGSGLTRLQFRLKDRGATRAGRPLPARFSVTLYPNSVFYMPLSTNRLYTHEIRPGAVDAEKLPTRLGYVVRCSSTEAVHRGGATYIEVGGAPRELEPPTQEGMSALRRMYAEENRSAGFVDYGEQFLFSMNKGDYAAPGYRPEDEFRQYSLAAAGELFDALLRSVRFEDVGKGRQGAVLVKVDAARGVPLVRTTTRYETPAQRFAPVHTRLARMIESRASLPIGFNNALIENYTNTYATMGMHSDQAQDLASGSFIALYSCYEHPERERAQRTLVVQSKAPGRDAFEIPLRHGGVVVFSLATNRRFIHKIVLDRSRPQPENRWLGVTFRTSRVFARYEGGRALLEDGTPLTLADEDRRRELYKLRGRENKETDFVYPPLAYTISASDLMPPA